MLDYLFKVTIKTDFSTYSDEFKNLEQAIAYINYFAKEYPIKAFINNKEIKIRNKIAVGDDNEPFCINEKWHKIFANYDYPKLV